jgi:DNA topoisomerase-1
MIAWSLAHILNLKDPKRIVFNNTTNTAIQEAIANPKKINYDLVDAQKARRVLDRLVGYEASPILWKNMGHALSAGRVQSVVVKVILDREKEIEKFFEAEQNSCFRFQGKFVDKKKKQFNAVLYSTKQKIIVDENDDIKEDKAGEKEEDVNESGTIKKGNIVSIEDTKKTREIMKDISNSTFKFTGSIDKDSLRYPSTPFTTATLQQEAGRKLGYATKRTMDAAQRLYEAGHITYHRTDSVSLSEEALKTIKDFIFSEYGKDYYRQVIYKSKGENTQEAHEAVRPTHVEIKGLSAEGRIGSDEIRLYNLIWKRSIASQMVPAKYKVRTVQIGVSKLSDYYFQTKTEELMFVGYLTIYNIGDDEDKENQENSSLIEMPKIGDIIPVRCVLATEEFKKPPMRYSEITLNKKIDPNRKKRANFCQRW